jgi:hypothetical protein
MRIRNYIALAVKARNEVRSAEDVRNIEKLAVIKMAN